MEKNVGRGDQVLRAVIGPSLMVLGYNRWGGKERRWPGLFAMALGWFVSETARARSCPVNELLGIDTTGSSVSNGRDPAGLRFREYGQDPEAGSAAVQKRKR